MAYWYTAFFVKRKIVVTEEVQSFRYGATITTGRYETCIIFTTKKEILNILRIKKQVAIVYFYIEKYN